MAQPGSKPGNHKVDNRHGKLSESFSNNQGAKISGDMKTAKSSSGSKSSPRKGKKGGTGPGEICTKTVESNKGEFSVQTVEILKRPGQSLGFYIREGNGYNRNDGVFISRIAPGSIVESNGLLRIGDEIITVNSVNVSRMSLDDVVILMSIPKRLVLTIRTQKSSGSKNASCPSLSQLELEEEPPVVVLKNRCRSNSSSAVEIPEMEKCLDEFILARSGMNMKYASEYSTYGYKSHPKSAYPSYKGPVLGDRQYIDDSGDSGLSSENSGCSATGKDGHSPGITPQDKPLDVLESRSYEVDLGRYSPRLSATRDHGVTFHSPVVTRRNPYVQIDYSSDSEARYSFDSISKMGHPQRLADPHSVKAFQDEIERTHHHYQRVGSLVKKDTKFRNLSPDRYNSDSEVVRGPHHGGDVPRDPHISRLLDTEGRSNSLPQMDASESSEELKHWLKKFDNLSFGAKEQPPSSSQQSQAPQFPNKPPVDTFTSEEYQRWLTHSQDMAATAPSYSGGGMTLPQRPDMTFPRQSHNNGNTQLRLSRKQSSESLSEYKPEEQGLYGYATIRSVSSASSDGATKGSPRGKVTPMENEGQALSSAQSRLKDLQLARKPLQIKTDEFRLYLPESEDQVVIPPSSGRRIQGLLAAQLFCGHGLKSSRTVLRDLYCVMEVDGISKARTMIRTGAINFDWDEAFDIELENAQELAFHVYSWDPNTRHRLCFSTTVVLPLLLNRGHSQKIALKMEPKGILYLGLDYQEPAITLKRMPSVRRNAQFGVDLEAIVKRDKCEGNVPDVLRRCVEEVDRRGLECIGIYRLCGSARRKTQLKLEFEKTPRAVSVSVETVSDINVVTGVIKDFLRELPEPLFTNSLYQMLMDALSVRIPDDPDGNAKLMLSVLDCLPKPNQDCLCFLLDHLKRVTLKSDVNKMTSSNLAICFGPVLLCPSPQSSAAVAENAMDFKKHNEVLRYLLDIWPQNRECSSLSSETLVSSSPHSSTNTIQTAPADVPATQRHSVPTDTPATQRQWAAADRHWDDAEVSSC